jgi:rubrerythrin
MAESSSMLERFKKVGSRFAFELFIEVFYDDIIKGFREFLDSYTKEDIRKMVKNLEFPYIDPQGFEAVRGYEQYLEKISPERLAEAMVRARRDLADVLFEDEEAGGIYILKLREHYLDILKHPEKAHAQQINLPQGPPRKMKLLTCLTCNQSWPVAEEDVPNVKECPFCGTPVDQPGPPNN